MAIASIRNIINRICCYRFLYKANKRFFQGRKNIVISNLAAIRTKIGRAQEFKEYLSKIDLESREDYKGKCIGFVVAPYEWGDWYQYSINLAVMLYKKGYDIEILVDDLPCMEEQAFFEGITDISILAARDALEVLTEKIKITYLSEYEPADFEESERFAIQKIYDQSLVWLRAHTGENFAIDIRDNFLDSAKRVKKYISTTKCDTINVYTGIHFRKGVYNYFAQKIGLRCSTYDSVGQHGKPISFSCNGPQAHCTEIDYVINTNMLAKIQTKIIEDIKDIYSLRMKSSSGQVKGDILIPLNIMWDAATLNLEGVFSDYKQWLTETVEFILKNTMAVIVIREHPAKMSAMGFYYEDLESQLQKLEGYESDRVIWISAENTVSTYDYIMQCKIVLPYATTVGIEAICMGKKVVCGMHNYYVRAGIVTKHTTKQTYFDEIQTSLVTPIIQDKELCGKAMLAIALHKEIFRGTRYCEINTPWKDIAYKYFEEDETIQNVLLAIAENIPFCYSNLLDQYE